jgi:hypothetical protein
MNHFTVNPALPHPDSDSDTTITLDDAVALAYTLLRHEEEGPAMQHARRRAAFALCEAYATHMEQNK